MSKWNISLLIATVFALYLAFNCWQDEKAAKKEVTTLTNQIEQLEQSIIKNNQIIADNEQSKHELENQSQELQEQINEQLKDNDCANKRVPESVSNSMYNRAKSIRKSTNTSKPIK